MLTHTQFFGLPNNKPEKENKMNKLQKIALMKTIATKLGNLYDISQINAFLEEFNILKHIHNPFDSKDVYVINSLSGISDARLIKISKELKIDIPNSNKPVSKNSTAKPEIISIKSKKPPANSSIKISIPPKYQIPPPMQAFISYETADVDYANSIKKALKQYNIEAFIAYEDAREAEEFPEEILKALNKMTFFISIHTENFSKSVWCQQEVGFAFARDKIKIIPIRLRASPEGFIDKVQAITRDVHNVKSVAKRIIEILETSPKTKNLYLEKIAPKINRDEILQNINRKRVYPKTLSNRTR